MITFKQKEFFWGAALTVGSTALLMKQGSDQMKQAEEQAEAQRKSDAKTRAALEKLANSGDPKKQEAASLFSQRSFAALPMSIMRGMVRGRQGLQAAEKAITSTKAGGFAKDILSTQKGNIKSAVGMAAGLAGTTYLGNRIATSIKDAKENNNEGNKSFLKKAALTTAAVGGGILAAKNGYLGAGAQNFITKGAGSKVLGAAKNVAKQVNPIQRGADGKISKLGTAMSTAFVAIPTISYLAQEKSQNDMEENTQREYAISAASIMNGIRSGAKFVRTTAKKFKANPGLQTTSGINQAASYLGFYGKGGTKAVQNTVSKIAENGAKSGNVWTQKTADFLRKNETVANLGATAGTLALGGAAMKVGNSLVEKPMRAIDNDAYKMSDQENGKV